jgi:hypothetical protein
MIGHSAQMGALSASQATNHGDEGVEMTFAVTSGTRVKELHKALFYGSIAAVRVTHLLLRTERSNESTESIPEPARIAVLVHDF